jgi:hypothetical protein
MGAHFISGACKGCEMELFTFVVFCFEFLRKFFVLSGIVL